LIETAVDVGEDGAGVGVLVGAYVEVEVGFAVLVDVRLVMGILVVEFIGVEFSWG